MARLSVIIPGCNNKPEWWRRCLDSIRAACGPDDEILCVDDGSKEPVREEWVGAGEDKRVRILRKENGGLASARNFGVDHSTGRYVTFVDSDDAVKVETFERCVKCLEATGADVAVYGVEVIWEAEGLRRVDVPSDHYYGPLSPADVLALREARLLNYACNKVYRLGFLKSASAGGRTGIEFPLRGMPCEDIVFNLDCIMAGAKYVSVGYPGYRYFHRIDGSLVSVYKPFNGAGMMAGANAWRRYAESLDGEKKLDLAKIADAHERSVLSGEWKNIWKPGTPYSLVGRWQWLKEHRELGGFKFFVKTMLFFFARRHLYFSFIRRWHLKRMYPSATKYRPAD